MISFVFHQEHAGIESQCLKCHGFLMISSPTLDDKMHMLFNLFSLFDCSKTITYCYSHGLLFRFCKSTCMIIFERFCFKSKIAPPTTI